MNVSTDAHDQFQTRETVNDVGDGRMQRSVPEQYTAKASEKEVRKENEPISNKQKRKRIW